MGNTSTGGSEKIKYGQSASLEVNKAEGHGHSEGEYHHYEIHSVSYHIDDRTCKVLLKMMKSPGSNRAKKFYISITDSDKMNFLSWRLWPYRFEMKVTREEGEYVKVHFARTDVVQDNDIIWLLTTPTLIKARPPRSIYKQEASKNTRKFSNPDGTVSETCMNPYMVRGREKQRGLVVIECKKKRFNKDPFVVIVSHYFAAAQQSVGFSVVAKIRGQDLELEGPVSHPVHALFEMFNEVSNIDQRWTPDLCSHCAAGKHLNPTSNSATVNTNDNNIGAFKLNNEAGPSPTRRLPKSIYSDSDIEPERPWLNATSQGSSNVLYQKYGN